MSSKREAIIAELAAALGEIEGVTVARRQVTPLERTAVPVILLQPLDETIVERKNNQAVRVMRLEVGVVTRGSTADTDADAWCVQAHAKMAGSNNAAGALSIVEQGTRWQLEDADGILACLVSTIYAVTYRTHIDRLTT